MKYEDMFDRGVLDPSHPPVVEVGTLGTSKKNLKAGTVLKVTTKKYEPAGDSDTPVAVLLEDVPSHTDDVTAFVLRHGVAVRSRLLNYATGSETAASDTLADKLPSVGIYLSQGGWKESDFK